MNTRTSLKYMHPAARERVIVGRMLLACTVACCIALGGGFIWGHFVGHRDAIAFLGNELLRAQQAQQAAEHGKAVCEKSFWGQLVEPRRRNY